MSVYFKHVASAHDLREVQCNVLWEWAVSTRLSIPDAAAKFCRTHRNCWPYLQLGDPQSREDRCFSADEREIIIILRRLEARYGKVRHTPIRHTTLQTIHRVLKVLIHPLSMHRWEQYDTGSSTDRSVNLFQRVHCARVAQGPVWVRNTRGPRAHVEAILRKYG